MCAGGWRAKASRRSMPNSQSAIPTTAQRLMPGDRSRITRALEVVLATGRSLSDWHREGMPRADRSGARGAIFPRCRSRRNSAAGIDTRFDAMLANGALDGSGAARRARARSHAAGDEGAWRALADPPSARARSASTRRPKAASATPSATPSGRPPGSATRRRTGPGYGAERNPGAGGEMGEKGLTGGRRRAI